MARTLRARSPSQSWPGARWACVAVALAAAAACGGGEPQAPACAAKTVETDTGLELKDLDCGSGKRAERGATLTVHYVGELEGGRVFDSSRRRGAPFQFALGRGQVIQGWDEGLVGMKVGGTRRLVVPPELAYGPDGFPPAIPPNATLIFEVELLEARGPRP